MKNYDLVSLPNEGRVELKALLNLTSCEVSINELPAGVSVPFVHSHKQNEEVYIVLSGAGKLFIDGEEKAIKAGDAFRIAPNGKRCISAGSEAMKFICIQAKEGSLEQFTDTDGVLNDDVKPSWL